MAVNGDSPVLVCLLHVDNREILAGLALKHTAARVQDSSRVLHNARMQTRLPCWDLSWQDDGNPDAGALGPSQKYVQYQERESYYLRPFYPEIGCIVQIFGVG